ncbi:ATP-dependent helicase [uncultured Duncaniella sp.]|uniref:ATP-dependent helicase n=1 Tax=uncultured Duncaniella sp. TaxID=2768039 RepID=UPI0025D5380D|nr:UvrD-helicase domain-containing protein [uncultured Duncaniella sp.]
MDPEEYLGKLNTQQRAAVEYCDGPQLVIAGAGSGKTRVLTYKIVHLLAHGYEPWRILALTFTNKAAREMRERIETLVGPEVSSRLWMGTFHSIFARILRQNAERIGFKSSFTICDAADSKALVKLIIKDMELDDKVYKPSTVHNSISWAKNALISPEDYALNRDLQRADANARRPRMCEIYRCYRDRCRVAGAMDFDDLLFYTNVLFRDHPDVCRHYQEYFRYVLVDEYQDTNFAQHLIVRQLTGGSGSLCVVGDDAQSIYSFRGANIRNILEMENAYPGLQTFKLERNYRSTQNIIDAAGSLISKNVDQIPKNVYSENDRGTLIDVVKCYSDYEEAAQVAARVSQIKRGTGDSFDETAILYRTNAQSRVLEESLRKRNVPYRIYGGLSFYQRKEVKDAIAYFRLSLNPDDDEALRRIINFPARGIGDTTLGKLTRAAMDEGVSLWAVISDADNHECGLNAGTKRKLSDFSELIKGFIDLNAQGRDAYDVARNIIERTGLYSMLVHDSTPESISKQENLQELLKGVKEYVDSMVEQGREDVSLGSFMTEVSLATDQDVNAGGEEECVTLMTVHAAKGLEFDNVFIVGVEEELFPSAMAAQSPAEIEEERRLLYVAITRARKYCMISYATQRFRNGQTVFPRPSRFIGDIDPRYLHVSGGRDFIPSSSMMQQRRVTASYNASMAGSARPLGELRRTLSDLGPRTSSPRREASASAAGAGDFTLHSPGEVSAGTRIRHSKFGVGLVKVVDTSGVDARMTVKFEGDDADTRTLLFKYAKFMIL